ncbi:TRAP transporter large permease subunit [Iocasia frigidifontis]|uniref:TRAP transporter large permease subunit n=1 Tax=Iocasia fonsfrigidae TaxID=2682810 RepID=A0A8A7KDF3_9FIRM|nr:TRAP transporter large permease [Iocasia fonsfrigidae]QTL99451.1 TRAP transporter large permease subunit [Iocasia fonsfrigidae]
MYFLIGVLLFLVALGIPVSFSIGLTSLFYMLKEGLGVITIPQRMVAGIDIFTLLSIPFFILAGNLMNTGGITKRIFRFASSIVGYIPGGLGHANVIASIIFAGMSGAALADAGGLGTIEIKAMEDEGYDTEFSVAVTAASSTIGPIFPPSIPMILFGAFGGVSVGKLFLGGAVPGLLIGLALMIMIYIISKKRNYPIHNKFDLGEIIESFKRAILPLFTPVIVLGGILLGIFTPTEAAIIASTYSLILGTFIYKEIKMKDIPKIFFDTAKTTSIVLIIISTASIYGWLLCREQVPQTVATALFSITQNPHLIMLILIGFFIVVGCFLETTAAIIILVPILVPLSTNLGIDPLHFGLVMILTLMLGLSTPPVGVVLYLIADIAKIKFERAVSATLPFLVPIFIVLLIITFFPQIVLFLPNLLIK